MSKENLELSRRKLLAGVGTAGIAAAGAGLGTTAYLNDTESFTGNTMTAGELDLILDYAGQYNYSGVVQSDGSQDTNADQSGTFQVTTGEVDGDATGIVQLDDVKPGDCGFLVMCPRLVDNPGYLWLRTEQTSDAENGYEEPEPNPGSDDDGGELDDEMLTSISYLPSGLPEVPLVERDVCTFGAETPLIAGGPESSAASVLSELSNGVQLDASMSVEGPAEPWPGSNSEATAPCILFSFHVPEDVENEIQGDSFSFNVEFYAEQARHNENPESPWATPTPTSTPTQTPPQQ